ncbi:MAG: 2-oxoglutarate dehydrogenase complex dihydrolipoyllysine-residue succinyltransferase [Pirellulales bacterium]|jgi:2-oxoglutarate dehydrogenase E2 component (dihydrolipoamide succinyltransferase)
MFEIKVPEFGESIQEVQVATWLKQPGDWIEKDEDIVELESEKASQALSSDRAGVLQQIKVADGEFAHVGDILCVVQEGEKPSETAIASSTAARGGTAVVADTATTEWIMPAAERVLSEYQISADAITPTGPGGRLLKEDVLNYVRTKGLKPTDSQPTQPVPVTAPPKPRPQPTPQPVVVSATHPNERIEKSVPMSMIRRTIAKRLVQAQQTAALLTTFNEIDMLPVKELRSKYKEAFLKKHGVKLGFMSFFAKAVVEGLKRYPAINSEVRGDHVIVKNYHDIGIAIGGGKGLVVPILRNVENMSFAMVEQKIGELAAMAQENKIVPDDLKGGTFTISNGGVYGSLLSTPIVNPPQSGILGLHTIQERPIALNGEVVIRPMMYVALTYDHRIVDGKEAVGFLKTIKEVLEEPARLFLEV